MECFGGGGWLVAGWLGACHGANAIMVTIRCRGGSVKNQNGLYRRLVKMINVNQLLSTVVFPDRGGIAGLVDSILGWIYGWAGSYPLSIIIFAFFLRTAFIPLDFSMKYFMTKNSVKMAAIKPEDEAIKETYADDPVLLNQKRQELYRKHGGGMAGMCIVSIINIAVMMIVLISVFQALNGLSNHNINNQFRQLQAVYQTHGGNTDTDAFREEINRVYDENNIRFLWVANIWRPDTPWAMRVLDWDAFRNAATGTGVQGSVFDDYSEDFLRAQYDAIFAQIEGTGRRWNGFLLLVIVAGGTTFASIWVNGRLRAKKVAKVTSAVEGEKEEEVSYSIRAVKNKSEKADGKPSAPPAFDPASMGKTMKFAMPVIMMMVAMMMTSAIALYIIMSSVFTTGYAFLLSMLVEKLIKRSELKKKEEGPDMTIINPHAGKNNPHSRYFRRKS